MHLRYDYTYILPYHCYYYYHPQPVLYFIHTTPYHTQQSRRTHGTRANPGELPHFLFGQGNRESGRAGSSTFCFHLTLLLSAFCSYLHILPYRRVPPAHKVLYRTVLYTVPFCFTLLTLRIHIYTAI